MISIQQLLTPVSQSQFRQAMVNALKTLGVPADQWKSGGIASSMLRTVSTSLGGVSSGLATILQGFFLPTAAGNGLELLAFYMYGQQKPPGTFASGNLTLTNGGGGIYNVGVGQFTALSPTTGVTYTNTAAFNLGAFGSPTASISVPIAANVPGSAGNAAPNTISQPVTTLLGVTTTNPTALVGVDPITDAALRQLCLNSLGARSVRGPRAAYAYAIQIATNAVTGAPVNINRWTISNASHTGQVSIVVASPSGAPDPNDVVGVIASIEQNARPDGVTVAVFQASPTPYTATLNVTAIAPAGVTTAAVGAAVEAQLNTFTSLYPIGGVSATDDSGPSTGLFLSGVYGACGLGCQAAGATLVAVQGATDLALGLYSVATNDTSVSVTLIPSQGNS